MKNWDSKNIPNQKSKLVIVTGSNSGIGFETARVLALKGATVIVAVRDLGKGKKAASKIKDNYPDAKVEVMRLDLANLKSVKSFVRFFKKKYSKLHLLINNAGVMMPPYSRTEDGFELQFGTNHLGHFALTGYLLNLLKRTQKSRVITVSSMGHKFGRIDFSDLNWEKRNYRSMSAYSDSKLANLYFTYELHKRLKANNLDVISVATHPGWTATNLQRYTSLFGFLNPFFGQKVSMGALPTLRAATQPMLNGGEYFGPGGFMEMKGYPVRVKSRKLFRKIGEELWNISEELTGVKYKF